MKNEDVTALDLPRDKTEDGGFDLLQQQYIVAEKKHREASDDMRRLRLLLRVGICEVCGAEFTRLRVTKRVCSQKCNTMAYARRFTSKRHPSSLARIREALPIIKAGGLLTERAIAILEKCLGGDSPTEIGLSRQRLDQVLGQASKIAKTVLFMRAAIQQLEKEQHAQLDAEGVKR